MKIAVLDTETTGLQKPFIYDIGVIIYDTDKQEVVKSYNAIIEQVWNNRPLFESAYYAEKRPIYVGLMRSRQAKLTKFGNAMKSIKALLRGVDGCYAFNSKFDDKAIEFNCQYYGCINPFDTIPMFDIRGYAIKAFGSRQDYVDFCKKHEFLTETGSISTTAESFYAWLNADGEYTEHHTAIDDSIIELEILNKAVNAGLEYQTEYEISRQALHQLSKKLEIYKNRQLIYSDTIKSVLTKKSNDSIKIYLKAEVEAADK